MGGNKNDIQGPKKIGEYLKGDREAINQGLRTQQQLARKVSKKLWVKCCWNRGSSQRLN